MRGRVSAVRRGIELSLIACLVACASAGRPPSTIAPSAQDFTLGAGDTFEVSVYGEDDLSGKYRIAEDGTINFPLVGRIAVSGKPPGEIADLIQQSLLQKNILRDPHVSVFLLEQTSKHVAVAGSVAKPGNYPLTAGMTIIDAISAAGGLSSLASGNHTIVTRRVDGKLQRYTIEVEKIIEGTAEDFALQDSDIVYVPERVF
jgi:protein involved in polysaccharide export with SLBB domain